MSKNFKIGKSYFCRGNYMDAEIHLNHALNTLDVDPDTGLSKGSKKDSCSDLEIYVESHVLLGVIEQNDKYFQGAFEHYAAALYFKSDARLLYNRETAEKSMDTILRFDSTCGNNERLKKMINKWIAELPGSELIETLYQFYKTQTLAEVLATLLCRRLRELIGSGQGTEEHIAAIQDRRLASLLKYSEIYESQKVIDKLPGQLKKDLTTRPEQRLCENCRNEF